MSSIAIIAISVAMLTVGFLLGLVLAINLTEDHQKKTTLKTRSSPLATKVFPWDVRFSPQGGCKELLVQYINDAKKSIRIMIYEFTHQDIIDAVIAAKLRGVDVKIVLDRGLETSKWGPVEKFKNASIDFKIDRKHKIHHNKVLIIDEVKLFTGSFNFTNNAEKANAENLLMIEDGQLCSQYLSDWEHHYEHSVLPGTPKTRDELDFELELLADPNERE